MDGEKVEAQGSIAIDFPFLICGLFNHENQ